MKKILLTLSALSLMSSMAMAAPITDLSKGESVVGYSYWNTSLKVDEYDFGKTNVNGFYAESAIDDKFSIGVESTKVSKNGKIYGVGVSIYTTFIDVSLKYKIDENFQLIAGNRNYDNTASVGGFSASDTINTFFYGVGATTGIGKTTSAYASVIHSDVADDWQVGINRILSKDADFNVNYRSYSEDGISLKGVGAGISYKF